MLLLFIILYVFPSCFLLFWDVFSFRQVEKPPPTPKKLKQKESQVQMTESDDGDLSPDNTKPTKKKKKQMKIFDALSQQKIKATKTPGKKTSTTMVPSTNPEPPSKKTLEQLESENSIHGAEGPKVKKFTLIS